VTGTSDPPAAELARTAVAALVRRGQTVAVAESLTGGLVAAALTSVPGSSAVFLGAIVAYATRLKTDLLGVPEGLLAVQGTVDEMVAAAMASGVRERLGATYGLATTGVAGPGPAEGKPSGTVFVAICGPGGPSEVPGVPGLRSDVYELREPGDRESVRAASVRAVLSLLVRALPEDIS
jgi:nicotinamide-nucleotide amidase